GVNLSANPNAKFPDTKYAKFAGVLPQVFTVFGFPLWDTNTLGVTLDFPAGAQTARLLYCGLGSDIYGGGWRQYFPAGAYPGAIAPTDEVLYSALATGVLSIGMNALALATDVQLARTWTTIKNDLEVTFFSEAWAPLVSKTIALTAAEGVATEVCGGLALYATLAQFGADIKNLWGLLLRMGTVVPKLLFSPRANPFWRKVARSLLADETATKIVNNIPLMGQVLAILAAVGDAAALAQAGTAWAVCPWVIENEVSR